MNAIESSLIAERCQRNWDFENPPTEEHINTIIEAARNMPTKQNNPYYRIIASTDYDFNKQVYDVAIDPNNKDFNRPVHRNTQVLAPLLLLFVPSAKNIPNRFFDDESINFHTAIGIASGVAAHTAASLGYKTGFCCCLDYGPFLNLLRTTFDIDMRDNGVGLALGIGHALEGYNRWDVVKDGVKHLDLESDSRNKDIEVIRL